MRRMRLFAFCFVPFPLSFRSKVAGVPQAATVSVDGTVDLSGPAALTLLRPPDGGVQPARPVSFTHTATWNVHFPSPQPLRSQASPSVHSTVVVLLETPVTSTPA